MSAPYQAFSGSDGRFVVGAANQRLWLRFLDVIGRPELANDPRYVENKDRVAHRDVLARGSGADLRDALRGRMGRRLPRCGRAGRTDQLLRRGLHNDHARARQAMIEIDHPVEGKFKALGFPVKMSGPGPRFRLPPPLLGQHTREVLDGLGLEGNYNELAAAGAFGE